MKKVLLSGLLFVLLLNIVGCSTSNDDKSDSTSIKTKEEEKEKEDGNPKLFDDKDCWSVTIGGVEHTFPMKYEEFIAKGWEVYNLTLDDALYSKVTNPNFEAIHNETGISFDLVLANFGNEEIDYKDGYVVGISKNFVVTKSVNDKMPEIVLPGGIVFNEQPPYSEMEDVYGKCNKEEYSDKIYVYGDDILTRCWEFSYDEEYKKLNGFSITNYIDPEEE